MEQEKTESPVLAAQQGEISFFSWKAKVGIPLRGTILIVNDILAQKTAWAIFREFADRLGHFGFDVVAFDHPFRKYELDDQQFITAIGYTKQAIERMRVLGRPPYSLLALGKGAPIAVHTAAQMENGNLFENLILIAPRLRSRKLAPGNEDLEAASLIRARFLLLSYKDHNKSTDPDGSQYLTYVGVRNILSKNRGIGFGQPGNPPTSDLAGTAKLLPLASEIGDFIPPPR